ncbi:WAT1-related protein At4g30420 [Aegilops tauschii subsp. strangulata]|uniref:WAT1-related protein n=1 Tax=Aegilops tauschii subsp. strangulata TaxID=200361 RepID=A0A453KW85_AEGTS|nr:WAT1-related protein At4g30420 [Aegilops tauschii subsp. strangulata]
MAMEEHKPLAAMVVVQCIYAAMALWAKAMFSRGMNPMVFVVYRQAIATAVLVPITLLANRKRLKEIVCIGTTGFALVFLASLVGATANQYMYYQGIYLGSSSMATAMTNLIPAITFVLATSVGLESVEIRKPRSLAKIFGTAVCVGGAMVMTFLKGPKLLHDSLGVGGAGLDLDDLLLLNSPASRNWVMGALFLVGSSSCWSLWLIIQVPICKSYVDPLTLSAWMCFLSTAQMALLNSFVLPDLDAWKINSLFELMGCIFAGAVGSGVTFYLQSWCITVRGPLYSAMFNPLCTVVTTVLATVILHEQPHIGSLLGAFAVVAGLYIVLWGKAGDAKIRRAAEHAEDLEKTWSGSQLLDAESTITEPLLADDNQIEK